MQITKFEPKVIYDYTAKNKIPYSLLWNITDVCNLQCKHCYLEKGAGYVSLSVAKDIVRFIKEKGIFEVTLSGGECLLHPDFEEIYIMLKNIGVYITIFTNATNFTPKIQQLFRKYRPYMVEVSIYGYDEKTYYENTGNINAYKQFMDGLEYLHNEKIPTIIKTPITNKNYIYLDKYVEIAQKYGFKYKFGTILFPMLNGEKKPLAERVDAKTIVDIEFADKEALDSFIKLINKKDEEMDSFEKRCSSCGNHYIINTDNSFVICSRIEQPRFMFYDYASLENAFKEVTEYKNTLSTMYESSVCGKCTLQNYCPGCPANLLQENGRLDVCNSYLREITCNKLEYLKNKRLTDDFYKI